MRNSLQFSFAIATLVSGCMTARSIAIAPSDGPMVVVGRTSAKVVFPRESTSVFSWDVPSNNSYKGRPEYVWMAKWYISEGRLGKDPDGVSAVVRYEKGSNRTVSLSQLLAAAETTVNTTCMNCGDLPSFTPEADPAVQASAVDGRVVITITGSAAVKRLFPFVPDSVYLGRSAGAGGTMTFEKVGVSLQ